MRRSRANSSSRRPSGKRTAVRRTTGRSTSSGGRSAPSGGRSAPSGGRSAPSRSGERPRHSEGSPTYSRGDGKKAPPSYTGHRRSTQSGGGDRSNSPAPPPARAPRPRLPGRCGELTLAERRYLRGLAHPLKPLASVGKDGVTDAFVKAVQELLIDHELVKVRLLQTCPVSKQEVAADLPMRTGAALVQQVGKTVLLYAPHPTAPRIDLRAAGKAQRPSDT